MTIQKVATSNVDASFKAKWLRWWNSSTSVKDDNKFSFDFPLKEKVLTIGFTWLLFGLRYLLWISSFSILDCFNSFSFLTVFILL